MTSRLAVLPDLAWQPSLLGGCPPCVDGSFATLERMDLAEGAWVDVVPGWLSGADALFDHLLHEVAWLEHEVPMYEQVVPQPRLSTWWGRDTDRPWPEPVPALAAALSQRYEVPFDTFGANLYRSGSDSVAWHGDRVLREQDRALVAVLTLGAARTFLLRPHGGGTSIRLRPAAGDLLVMGGTCQRTWQHSVPKTTKPTGPRISITLRPSAPVPA